MTKNTRPNASAKYVLAERTIKILEVLKKYTDENHTLKQSELREKLGESEMGNSKTFADTINKIMNALNPDFFDGENAHKYHITHKALEEEFLLAQKDPEAFETLLDEMFDAEEEGTKKKVPISELRYVQPLTYDELDAVINSVYFSKALTEEERDSIVMKLANLSSEYYKRRWINVNGSRETIKGTIKGIPDNSALMKGELASNLKIVRQAIEDKAKIQFHFNGYGYDKELHPLKTKNGAIKEYVVTPYYVVAYNGRYYAIVNTEPYDNFSIYRIDLMSNLHLAVDEEGNPLEGRPAREIDNLPEKWDENEFAQHLNMYYDEPVNVTLKIKNNKYTMLADCFGAKYNKMKSLDEEYDLVLVNSSPQAMVNWALQYSDAVEVIGPATVREAVGERIRKLCGKYGVE